MQEELCFMSLQELSKKLTHQFVLAKMSVVYLSHENGKTLQGMISILDEIGYNVVPVQVLKAINYKVPQKENV
jgi:site-specific DNA-cytosine methylase